jgi:hypothetical protein
MRSRAVRATLVLFAVVAIGAAAYFFWTTRTGTRVAAEGASAFEAVRASAIRDAFELRSAQQAYVAAGQTEAFWFERVVTITDSLRSTLSTLSSAAPPPAAQAGLEEAVAALEDFEQSDRRIRRYASTGQKLLASDIIFSDGLEASSRIITALDRAGTASVEAIATGNAVAEREQLMAVAGAAVFAILVMLMLVPVRAGPRTAPVQPAEPAEPIGIDGPGLNLRAVPGTEKPAAPPVAVADTSAVPPLPQSTIEIQRLAGVCADLARLSDTENLPEILAKTAAMLEASGLVLWVVDLGGKELVPIAAYGYPASVLSRMGTLRTDAENATAAAFRTGLLQTVSTDAGSHGAIAAPLVSPSGSRGVMAAEVRHEGEKQPARLAAAAIVAAQLATIIGPPVDQNEDRGTAAL